MNLGLMISDVWSQAVTKQCCQICPDTTRGNFSFLSRSAEANVTKLGHWGKTNNGYYVLQSLNITKHRAGLHAPTATHYR